MLASSCSVILIKLAKQTKGLQFETKYVFFSRGLFVWDKRREDSWYQTLFCQNGFLNAFVLYQTWCSGETGVQPIYQMADVSQCAPNENIFIKFLWRKLCRKRCLGWFAITELPVKFFNILLKVSVYCKISCLYNIWSQLFDNHIWGITAKKGCILTNTSIMMFLTDWYWCLPQEWSPFGSSIDSREQIKLATRARNQMSTHNIMVAQRGPNPAKPLGCSKNNTGLKLAIFISFQKLQKQLWFRYILRFLEVERFAPRHFSRLGFKSQKILAECF